LPYQKKAGDAPALQKINHPAHKSFHFGAITSRDYTSQPLKPPMWRNGRRNGLKIAIFAIFLHFKINQIESDSRR
jgi:hypothetical protein